MADPHHQCFRIEMKLFTKRVPAYMASGAGVADPSHQCFRIEMKLFKEKGPAYTASGAGVADPSHQYFSSWNEGF